MSRALLLGIFACSLFHNVASQIPSSSSSSISPALTISTTPTTPTSGIPSSSSSSSSSSGETPSVTGPSSTPNTSSSGSSGSGTTTSISSSSSTTTSGSGLTTLSPNDPDVLLNVPRISVSRIELDVDDLQAELNLNANVAGLVSINAGVQVSIQKVNITIAGIEAQAELIVRLGRLVDVVNRVFQSLDLNPLLIAAINNVTSLLTTTIGAVDGLLGSITQGSNTLSFTIDNLGNIVQQVAGAAGGVTNTIVGNYQQNMTYTGMSQQLQSGLIQKTYSYTPLNALVNIVFNQAGQIVQATVSKPTSSAGSSTSSPTSTPSPSPRSPTRGSRVIDEI